MYDAKGKSKGSVFTNRTRNIRIQNQNQGKGKLNEEKERNRMFACDAQCGGVWEQSLICSCGRCTYMYVSYANARNVIQKIK